ncbi:MAG: glycosyltransferase family 39 protein [Elusimicrobia bacterium]|nr:glycosyltransferase family 39 protein [Elusimicrobiota bacterium]
MTPTRLSRKVLATTAAALALGAAVLHVLWASRIPIGYHYDDALHILLSRRLLSGSYSLPNGSPPLSEPLPGFPLFLSIPAALVAPHWERLRWLCVLISWGMVAASWRLARRFLPEGWAAAAAALVAFNTGLMMWCGAVIPDVLYTAVSLALFAGFEEKPSNRRLAGLAAGAGAAALLRPHGAALILSLAAALAAGRDRRRAAAFLLMAAAAPAAWALRSLLLRLSPGYLSRWTSIQSFAEPGERLAHAVGLLQTAGGGLFGLAGAPGWLLAAAGVFALAAAAYGAARGFRQNDSGRVSAISVYAVILMLMHLSWVLEGIKYLIPLLPLFWILILTGLRSKSRALAAGLAAASLVLCLRQNIILLPPAPAAATILPGTMDWIRRETPAEARFQSVYDVPVMLFTGRPAIPFAPEPMARAQWLDRARADGVDYVLVNTEVIRGTDWFRTGPELSLVQHDPIDGSLVYRLERGTRASR